jgi:hypothetical protein
MKDCLQTFRWLCAFWWTYGTRPSINNYVHKIKPTYVDERVKAPERIDEKVSELGAEAVEIDGEASDLEASFAFLALVIGLIVEFFKKKE